jgi:hypothetical protein
MSIVNIFHSLPTSFAKAAGFETKKQAIKLAKDETLKAIFEKYNAEFEVLASKVSAELRPLVIEVVKREKAEDSEGSMRRSAGAPTVGVSGNAEEPEVVELPKKKLKSKVRRSAGAPTVRKVKGKRPSKHASKKSESEGEESGEQSE